MHLQSVDLTGSFNDFLASLGSANANALPSGQDPEVTQPIEAAARAPEAANGCAREEKNRVKRE